VTDGLKGFFGSVTAAGWIQIFLLFAALIAMGTRAEYRLLAVEEIVKELRAEYIRKEVVELQLVALQAQLVRLQQSVDRLERKLE
jgi:Tfp pilus assembly protein PilO